MLLTFILQKNSSEYVSVAVFYFLYLSVYVQNKCISQFIPNYSAQLFCININILLNT